MWMHDIPEIYKNVIYLVEQLPTYLGATSKFCAPKE
jgi:hypothetical protein